MQIAGMAFANAFLGICHSMAHKLGAAYHVPHGLANAALISHVIRYNATDMPAKQAAFPQYQYPTAKQVCGRWRWRGWSASSRVQQHTVVGGCMSAGAFG